MASLWSSVSGAALACLLPLVQRSTRPARQTRSAQQRAAATAAIQALYFDLNLSYMQSTRASKNFNRHYFPFVNFHIMIVCHHHHALTRVIRHFLCVWWWSPYIFRWINDSSQARALLRETFLLSSWRFLSFQKWVIGKRRSFWISQMFFFQETCVKFIALTTWLSKCYGINQGPNLELMATQKMTCWITTINW